MKNKVTIDGVTYKVGDRIMIDQMDDNNGMDWQARQLKGKTGKIVFIDGMNQFIGDWGGLSIIPGTDKFHKL